MKCSITELEIESLYRRIKDEDIDLRPNFQRGEVWSDKKKKKLIDTIIRGWQIPPIHLVETNSFVDEVLDGQQRLVAIRDFMDDKFAIDGNIEPVDEGIMILNKIKYSKLDSSIQRKIKKYSIRLVRITDHKAEEAAELFFRLNQPSLLTSAEQRNAFFGTARDQVKELVDNFEKLGACKERIGFSNSRMAYDDIISKLCYTLELNTLSKKITSNDISNKFKSNSGFNKKIFVEVKTILEYFLESICDGSKEFNMKLSLNKATMYSWLLFIHRNKTSLNQSQIGFLIYAFENIREYLKGKEDIYGYKMLKLYKNLQDNHPYFQSMVLLFNQKSSMGSTDATSIVMRDFILEVSKEIILDYNDNSISHMLDSMYKENQNLQYTIDFLIRDLDWGEILE
jgi:hypothetical protein